MPQDAAQRRNVSLIFQGDDHRNVGFMIAASYDHLLQRLPTTSPQPFSALAPTPYIEKRRVLARL